MVLQLDEQTQKGRRGDRRELDNNTEHIKHLYKKELIN